MYFAVDPPTSDATLRAICESMDNPTDARWCALVDTAFDHGRRRPAWPLRPWPLYCRPPLDQLADAGPVLLELSASPALRRAEVEQLVKACSGRPMLGFVLPRETPQALVQAWQACVQALTSDGQRLVLRLADTRIAAVLSAALAPENWALLRAPLRAWGVVDRYGAWQLLPEPPHPGLLRLPEALTLDDDEFARLLQHGMADAVIDRMHELNPDLVPRDGRAAFHATVQQACDFAQHHRIEAFADLLALCVGVTADAGLLADPRLPALLAECAAAPGQLAERLLDWTPEPLA